MKGFIYMSEPLVSIICTAFNQEHYIAQAIESYLMQKTTFDIEIIIHDDASTDGTANVIREYEKKYPDLIKAIYQTENQYSKDKEIMAKIWVPYAKGKYIALNEGDDFWTDPLKLQKQVDFMENHPEFSLCMHAAENFNEIGNKKVGVRRPFIGDQILSVNDIISSASRSCALNSMLFRREDVLLQKLPEFYLKAPIGDIILQIFLSLQGAVYYMDRYMSVYRVNAKGSWTRSMRSIEKFKTYIKEIVHTFQEIDRYTEGKYHEAIEERIGSFEFELFWATSDVKNIKSAKYAKYLKEMKTIDKIKRYSKIYFPSLYRIYAKIKKL